MLRDTQALKDAGVTVEFLPVQGEGHMIANPRVYVRAAEFFADLIGGQTAAVDDLNSRCGFQNFEPSFREVVRNQHALLLSHSHSEKERC